MGAWVAGRVDVAYIFRYVFTVNICRDECLGAGMQVWVRRNQMWWLARGRADREGGIARRIVRVGSMYAGASGYDSSGEGKSELKV